jgi:hypothetical protein
MTIVCRSQKFIFVHLHKCGGTSVEQAFAPHAHWNDMIIGSTQWGEWLQPYYLRRYGLTKHSPALDIFRAVGPQMWSECWKVALVRHPLRIFESLYGWIADIVESYKTRHRLTADQFAYLCANDKLPATFARWPTTQAYAESAGFAEFIDILLTREWMTETLTRRLSRGGKLIVDDVYKLEEIDRFWKDFEARTGLMFTRLHANRSNPQEYPWDERHIDEIHRRFSADFVNFRYE